MRSDDKQDWRKAPTIAQVYDEVTKRIFANLTASQGKSKSKSKKCDSSKKKKHAKFDDLFSDNSDDESSDSEDEAPHHKSKKHSSKCKKCSSRDDSSDSDSSMDNESSSSDDSDSDSETSDDDLKYMGSSKKKHSSSHACTKDSKDRKPTKTGQRSSYSDVNQSKDKIANLTDRFHKLKLMLGQKSNDCDIPRDASFVNDPTYRQVAQILQKAAQEVEESKNNAQIRGIHLDEQQLQNWNDNSNPNVRQFGRCFVCHQANTHPCGSINCPEAITLVNQGLCKFRDGHLVMLDDSDPPWGAPNESLGTIIRQFYKSKQPSTSGSLRAAFAKIYDPTDYSDCYESDVEANPALWQHVYAADRTQKSHSRIDPIDKQKQVRWQNTKHDDTKPDKPKPKPKLTPYVEVPPRPKQWGNMKLPQGDAPVHQVPIAPVEPRVPNQGICGRKGGNSQ